MPFTGKIISFIDDTLKGSSFNKKNLQPAKFNGLSTVVVRKKDAVKPAEVLPAIVSELCAVNLIAAESKYAIQTYHKLISKAYSFDKKSYGDGYTIRSVSELLLVVFSNTKLSGMAKELLEPVVVLGIPQRLSPALFAELKISSCLITPISSNMNHVEVFRQEFPQSDYFLNEHLSMFSHRYKIDLTFSGDCVDQCLCN